jgi:hypothetical protein
LASGSSVFDSQVLESRFQENLGLPMGPRLVLSPRPLRLDAASAALLGIAAALLAIAWKFSFVLLFGATAAALAAAQLIFLALRRRRRFLLTPFERGLVVESRREKLTFLLKDLQTLELRERDAPGGFLRRLSLAGGEEKIRVEHFVRRGEEDRLGAVLVPLLARLVEITEQKLQGGHTLSGWDWTLSPEGLAAPAHDHPIPLAEIGAVTVRQHRISIWRPHERFPFFVLPDDSPNALVLMAFLSRRLEEEREQF